MNADQDLLFQHVKFLTTLRPFRNYQNQDSLEKVCDYLKQEFARYGLTATEQVFTARGSTYKNIIASYNPDKKQRLIVEKSLLSHCKRNDVLTFTEILAARRRSQFAY